MFDTGFLPTVEDNDTYLVQCTLHRSYIPEDRLLHKNHHHKVQLYLKWLLFIYIWGCSLVADCFLHKRVTSSSLKPQDQQNVREPETQRLAVIACTEMFWYNSQLQKPEILSLPLHGWVFFFPSLPFQNLNLWERSFCLSYNLTHRESTHEYLILSYFLWTIFSAHSLFIKPFSRTLLFLID